MKSDVEFLSLHGGPKTAQSTFDDYSAKGLQYTCPVYYYIHSKFSSASSLGGRQCALFVHAAVSSMVSTITWHHAELTSRSTSRAQPVRWETSMEDVWEIVPSGAIYVYRQYLVKSSNECMACLQMRLISNDTPWLTVCSDNIYWIWQPRRLDYNIH